MGSGKSVVGKLIAESLGRPFYDTDKFIEKKTNKLVSEIFEASGESTFRRYETECLVELMKLEPAIIAVGGGLPCYENNMELLLQSGSVIYLNTSLLTLIKRLKNEREFRPLLAKLSDAEFHPTIEAMLSERVWFYKKAHLFIPNEGNDPQKPVNEILKEIEKRDW